jgi:hypothetical protein
MSVREQVIVVLELVSLSDWLSCMDPEGIEPGSEDEVQQQRVCFSRRRYHQVRSIISGVTVYRWQSLNSSHGSPRSSLGE